MNQKIDTIEAGRTFSLSWKGRLIILTAALVLLGVFVYPDILHELLWSVLQREGSSHGLFVPFITGYFLWVKLPGQCDSRIIAKHALAQNITLAPGIIFSSRGLYKNFLRINGALNWSKEVEEAVRQVGEIIEGL